MKWAKRSSHSIQAGEFIISRATMQGQDMFTLWKQSERISHHDTAAKARQAAEQHKGVA